MPHLSQKFASRFEADLAAEFLEEHEIETFVSASDAGGAIPALQTSDGVRLEVATDDLARAEELVREWRSERDTPLAPLSSRQKIQSWLTGGLLLLILAWILGSIFSVAEDRVDIVEKTGTPQKFR
jgi:hypothetical protein